MRGEANDGRLRAGMLAVGFWRFGRNSMFDVDVDVDVWAVAQFQGCIYADK